MNENLHIIQRLYVDLQVSSRLNRPAVQQRLERMLEEHLMARLEPVFDRLAGPERWVDIDKLEVDVGCLPPEAKAGEWLEQAFLAYKRALEQKVKSEERKNGTSTTTPNLNALAYFFHQGYLPWWKEFIDLDTALAEELPEHAAHIFTLIRTPSARKRWAHQFNEQTKSRFLEALISKPLLVSLSQWQNLVPGISRQSLSSIYWETALEAAKEPANFFENWLGLLLQKTTAALEKAADMKHFRRKLSESKVLSPALKSQLLGQLPATMIEKPVSPEIWESLLPEFSAEEVQQLFEKVNREYQNHPSKGWIEILLRNTVLALHSHKDVRILVKKIQASAQIKKELKGKTQAPLAAYLTAYERAASILSPEDWAKLLPACPNSEVQRLYRRTAWTYAKEPEKDWIRLLVDFTLTALPGKAAFEAFQRHVNQADHLTKAVRGQALEEIERFIHSAERSSREYRSQKVPVAEEGIFAPLAGIVLIHPFLPAFFDRLGLLEEEQFRNEEARERAVHLLHFLAAGQEHPQEQELVLLKLLCGWEMEAPIARFIDLTDTEKTEANNLLEAVVQHWDVLEGTTPDELRATFFIREGKLKWTDLGWNLTVEQRGYDVIFNTLPWGLSPIMYGWMPEMVWVEWA